MAKSFRGVLLALVTVLMAISFAMAGTFLAKAVTVNDVTMVTEGGARVLIGGSAEDTGIKFDFKVNASEYDALVNQTTNGKVVLGVLIGKASAGELTESNCLDSYEVKTGNHGLSVDGEYYNYSFSITYSLSQVFNSLKQANMLDANLEYADASEDATFNAYVNQMYGKELVLRPYIKTVVNRNESVVLGEASQSRSMIHVAQAEIVTNGHNLPDGFAEKYIKSTVDKTQDDVTVYSSGKVEGVEEDIVSMTVGSSAENLVYSSNTISNVEAVKKYITDGTVELYGYSNDRSVYKYSAKWVEDPFYEATTVVTNAVIEKTDTSVIAGDDLSMFSGPFTLAKVYEINGQSVDVNVLNSLGEIDFNAVVDGVDSGEQVKILTQKQDEYYCIEGLTVCDKIFFNTSESRAEMTALFSDTVSDGEYYVLGEDITFDEQTVLSSSGGTEIFANTNNTAVFSGTLDGRGHVLNGPILKNASQKNSMFGVAGDGATIKNVAIINVKRYYNGNIEYKYGTRTSVLFRRPESSSVTVTLENVYIQRDGSASSSSASANGVIFASDYNDGDSTATELCTLNLTNVIIDYKAQSTNRSVIAGTGSWTNANASGTFNNVYFITNAKVTNGASTLTGINKYSSVEAMKDANNDYTGFSSKYWRVTEGAIPEWKAFVLSTYLKDSDGNLINSISITEIGEYAFNVGVRNVYGEQSFTASVSPANDNITLSGNVLTVRAGVLEEYTATLTVSSTDGSCQSQYPITINTKAYKSLKDWVFIERGTGKVFLNETRFYGEQPSVVTYNGVNVLVGDVVDVEQIRKVSGKPFTLDMVFKGAVYRFSNAVICDKVFVNTSESRAEMTSIFSDETSDSGYYVVLEDIIFDEQAVLSSSGATEIFANTNNTAVFSGRLDGRGHVLNGPILMNATQKNSMFGVAGDGATVENIAIINVKRYYNGNIEYKYGTRTSVLFRRPESSSVTVTLENVYIQRDGSASSSSASANGVIFASDYNDGDSTATELCTLNLTNVIIDYKAQSTNRSVIAGTGSWANANASGTFNNVYFITNAKVTNGASTLTGINKYSSVEAMKGANNNYTGFGSEYWTIDGGIPVWNTLPKTEEPKEMLSIVTNGTSAYEVIDYGSSGRSRPAYRVVDVIREATGAELNYKTSVSSSKLSTTNYYISVGNTAVLQKAIEDGKVQVDISKYEFKIAVVDNTIFLIGENERTIAYAVNEFLNCTLGFEVFGKIPGVTQAGNLQASDGDYKHLMYVLNSTSSMQIEKDLDYVGSPSFEIRQRINGTFNISSPTNDNYGSYGSTDKAYSDTMGYVSFKDNLLEVDGQYFHNSNEYVPFATHKSTHPKWFGDVSGLKVDDKGNQLAQLCYTAHGDASEYQQMVSVCAEKVIAKIMADTKGINGITFTVEDGKPHCDCATCTAELARYGTMSGVVCNFLNDMSEYVDDWMSENPTYAREFIIYMFAYLPEDRQAPVEWSETQQKWVGKNGLTMYKGENVSASVYLVTQTMGIKAYPGMPENNEKPDFDRVLGDTTVYDLSKLDYYDYGKTTARDHIEQWSDFADGTPMYLWYYTQVASNVFVPYYSAELYCDEFYSWLATKNIRSIYFYANAQENKASSGYNNLRAYVISKMLWDASLELDEVVDNWFENVFKDGAVVQKMREAYNYAMNLSLKASYLGGQIGKTMANDFTREEELQQYYTTVGIAGKHFTVSSLMNLYNMYKEANRLAELAFANDPVTLSVVKKYIDCEWISPIYLLLRYNVSNPIVIENRAELVAKYNQIVADTGIELTGEQAHCPPPEIVGNGACVELVVSTMKDVDKGINTSTDNFIPINQSEYYDEDTMTFTIKKGNRFKFRLRTTQNIYGADGTLLYAMGEFIDGTTGANGGKEVCNYWIKPGRDQSVDHIGDYVTFSGTYPGEMIVKSATNPTATYTPTEEVYIFYTLACGTSFTKSSYNANVYKFNVKAVA